MTLQMAQERSVILKHYRDIDNLGKGLSVMERVEQHVCLVVE